MELRAIDAVNRGVQRVLVGVLAMALPSCAAGQGRPDVRGGGSVAADARSLSAASSVEVRTGVLVLAAQASARRSRRGRRTGVSAGLAFSFGDPLREPE